VRIKDYPISVECPDCHELQLIDVTALRLARGGAAHFPGV
jgi:hypothetical protein